MSITLDMPRIKETSKEAVNKWFNDLMELIRENQIVTENIYNMDETGFSIGSIQGAYVVVNKDLQTKYQVQPGRQEWVTVLECICADGGKILSLIIFRVTKLEKIEWVEHYIEVRETALSISNIQGGWHGAGLHPLNRVRVTHSLPEISSRPSTPPPTSVLNSEHEINFSNILTTDSVPNSHVLRSLSELASKNELNTPAPNCIAHLARTAEQLVAENTIIKHRLENVEEILRVRQQRRQGKRHVLKGVNFISTQAIVEKLHECEKKSREKKVGKGPRKKKVRANRVDESKETLEEEEDEIEPEVLDVIVVERC